MKECHMSSFKIKNSRLGKEEFMKLGNIKSFCFLHQFSDTKTRKNLYFSDIMAN